MNEIFKLFLSLSLSGSLMILILFLCRHFWKDKLSRQWQYYIWLIVIARLLVPFTPETSLVGSIFQTVDHTSIQTDTIDTIDNLQDIEHSFASNIEQNEPGESNPPIQPFNNRPMQDITALLGNNLWLVWLGITLILLIRKITIYQSFVRYVKAGQALVSDIKLLDRLSTLTEQAGIKKPVELCVNPLISSPLLIGFFYPYIVLPSTEFSENAFRYTVLHELTHYRRRDMLYKWLVQIVVCLHWFNPLVYMMSQEINRACELSCDEAIIAKLDFSAMQEYGKTLLDAMGKVGNYKESLASVTLNENKKLLKERLGAIMSFKKKSKAVISLTLMLTFVISFGASYAGAYAAPFTASNALYNDDTNIKINNENTENPSAADSIAPSDDKVQVDFSDISITGQGPVGVELVRTSNSNVTFELLNMENEKNCTTKAEIINGILYITINNYVPNGINVIFGPDYKNVVRVYIPDAAYNKLDIKSEEMALQMQDFNASVHVESYRAGFWLIDKAISQGTYDINVYSGPIYIEADTILRDITANAHSGPLTVRFNQEPVNLYLDSTKCGPHINRPENWPAIYKIGNETPKIILSNTGKATLEVQSDKSNSVDSPINTEMAIVTIGSKVYYLIDTEQQLRSIGTGKYTLDSRYLLNHDIKLTEEWIAIGDFEHPFTGYFDGNGFIIEDLKNTDPNATLIGLFGYAKGATIHNVTLKSVDISSAGGVGKHVGAIVAIATDCEISDNQIID